MKDTGERLIAKGNTKTLTYGEHLNRYISVCDIVSNKTVLDVASGSGYGTFLLSKYAKKIYGIDNSSDAIKYSKNNYKNKNLEYELGDAEKMPYKDGSFDVVISFETIEHLKNPEEYLKEVKRVLKKDGIFVVSTPNDDEFTEGNEFHIHEYKLDELINLISKYFSNTKNYFQGTYFASGIYNETNFNRGFSVQNSSTSLTFGQDILKAIYFVIIASNSKKHTPLLKENTVLADSWSTRKDIETDKERNNHLERLNNQLEIAQNELNIIKQSKAWKQISKLRKLKNILRLGS